MSVIAHLADSLATEMLARGYSLRRTTCETVAAAMLAHVAKMLRDHESSHPAPPPGGALDGGCPAPSDASAVTFSSNPSALLAPADDDGGRDVRGGSAAPAVTESPFCLYRANGRPGGLCSYQSANGDINLCRDRGCVHS